MKKQTNAERSYVKAVVEDQGAVLEVIQLLSRDIDFYRKRTTQAVGIFLAVGAFLTFIAVDSEMSSLGRFVIVLLLLFCVRPVVRLIRVSTVRAKYVKLVRQELLKSMQKSNEEILHLSPITLAVRFDYDKESLAQKSVPSVTSQWVRILWFSVFGVTFVLLDPWTRKLEGLLINLWNSWMGV